MKKKKLVAVDLFCGGGGTSTGLLQACEVLGIDSASVDLTAVNHWDVAVATHAANHPAARHIQSRIEQLQPENIVPGGRADILWASPECIHHSVARGGKPRDDQSRSQAWTVLDWVQRLSPGVVCIENVPEFTGWGPLYVGGPNKGKPIPSKRGHSFGAWVQALESMNYRVEHRMLNCANFGDATTRRRFFLIARRGNRRPQWPAQLRSQHDTTDLFRGPMEPWRTARDVIDWDNPGHSIFLTQEQAKEAGVNIKRPLAANTLKRISAGIEKYWGEWAEPFLIMLRGTEAGQINRSTRTIDEPVPTLTAGGHVGVVEPFLVQYYGQGTFTRVDDPAPTVTTKARHGLVCPVVSQGPRVSTIDTPIPTITTAPRHGIVCPSIEPLILGQDARGIVRRASDPLPTIAGAGAHALVNPVTMDIGGEKFMLDILFRMLTPAELASAHSFPTDYKWCGTKTEIMKQVGNSVPVATAQAICAATIGALKAA